MSIQEQDVAAGRPVLVQVTGLVVFDPATPDRGETRWNAPGFVGTDPVFRRLWSAVYADPNDTNFV